MPARAKSLPSLAELSQRLQALPQAHDRRTGKPKGLTTRQRCLVEALLHGRDPAPGRALSIRQASVAAGYSDDRSGYTAAVRDFRLPHVQAEYLSEFAALVTASLGQGLATLLDVSANSRSDRARMEAAREVRGLFEGLVQRKEGAGAGQGPALIIHLDPKPMALGEAMRDITPDR